MSPKEKIQQLTEELKQHNYNYYVLAQPTISDREFDEKLKILEQLEASFPQFANANSPTQKVGGEITKNFQTVTHSVRMLSLSNTYNQKELYEFDERVRKGLGSDDFSYTAELKFDGFAIAIKYQNGQLVQAITRGDGTQGDDVTANIKTIKSIPHQLASPYPENLEIRGEIFIHKKAFERLNEERKEKGEALYANPRNTAAGTIKQQDSAEVAKRPLDGFMYQIAQSSEDFYSHYEDLQGMKKWGLPVNSATQKCKTMAEVWKFIDFWDKERKKLSFEIDGVVIKVNEKPYQEELGFTSKFPRWAISYKFETERVATKLLSISYQVGRTGAITPVANLAPVSLLGTTVKRASLHNADIITQLDIRVGDTVFVEKGGEIIPKIVDVDKENRDNDSLPTVFIAHCPECDTSLERIEGESAHYCPNELGCPPQIKGRIEHFISRKAMNVDSLGEGKIDLLYQAGLLHKPSQLYRLSAENLIGLSKTIELEDGSKRLISFKEKTVENILNGLNESQKQPFEKVLFALGIRYVGETVAKKLTQHFKTMDALMHADFETLIGVNEIGDRIANSLLTFFANPNHQEEIRQLREAGLQFEAVIKSNTSNILEGKKIVVSGVFQTFERNELKGIIEENGGDNVSSISKNTDFVLAGENMGPAKLEKAANLKIPIISEEMFRQMIGLDR